MKIKLDKPAKAYIINTYQANKETEMSKESRSEYTASMMLSQAPVRQSLKTNGWTVGANFANKSSKPVATVQQKSFFAKLLGK
jgi:hypothetical protein